MLDFLPIPSFVLPGGICPVIRTFDRTGAVCQRGHARVPIELPRLCGRADPYTACGRGGGARACGQEQGRGRLPTRARALKILPDLDSALQWSPAGSGLKADPARTLECLYARYVARYDSLPQAGIGAGTAHADGESSAHAG